jgi:hypothetical protein
MPALRFRHYALLEWLMTVDLSSVAVAKRPQELARRLRRDLRLPANQDTYAVAQALGGLPASCCGWPRTSYRRCCCGHW